MKNNNDFDIEKYLKGVFWFVVIIIILIVGAYMAHFGPKTSDSPSVWGTFGDYFGGILNPIISLLSLGLIAYLTIETEKNNNEEVKDLAKLERKREAFYNIANYIVLANLAAANLEDFIKDLEILRKGASKKDIYTDRLFKIIDDFNKNHLVFVKLNMELSSFDLVYGNLFNYDFKTEKYRDLSYLSLDLSDEYRKLISVNNDSYVFLKTYRNFIKEFKLFIEELKKEVS